MAEQSLIQMLLPQNEAGELPAEYQREAPKSTLEAISRLVTMLAMPGGFGSLRAGRPGVVNKMAARKMADELNRMEGAIARRRAAMGGRSYEYWKDALAKTMETAAIHPDVAYRPELNSDIVGLLKRAFELSGQSGIPSGMTFAERFKR